MPDSPVRQPVAGLVLNSGFHTKKISGAKRDLPAPVHSNQSPTVIETLENKGHDHRIKQNAKARTLVKPRLFVQQNNDKREKTAQKKADLKFPESLKNSRRNEHNENRAECPSRSDRKVKDR